VKSPAILFGAERAVNATVIETAVGRLLLHPPVSFPHGARLDLRIHAPPPAQGAAAAAAVVVAQGRPLPAPVPVLLTGATTPPVPHSGSQPAVPAALPHALPAGGIAVATVETAPPPGMLLRPAAAQIAPLPQGTILSVRVAGVTAPQQPPNAPMVPTPQAPGSVVQPQTAAAAGLVKPAAVTTSVSGAVTESQRPTQNPAPAMNTAPVTTTASAGGTRAASGAAPMAASSAPVGPPPSVSTDPSVPPASSRVDGGRVIAATVIGNAADGRLLVRADGTLIALANRAPLAPETVLRLEILGFERPPATASQQSVPPPPAVQPLSPLSPTWPALSEVIDVLRQTAPATAQALVTSTVPAANASLLANIMAFLFGVQFGNPRSWLGPQAVQALERAGRGDLLARLGDDFTQVARLAQDSGGGDWRMLLFPFFDEGHLHQVRMFLRDHRGGGGEEGEGEQGQRMIVDVDLSRLGRIQLDGLYRHDAFDLVLRSAAPLEEDARRDIVELFTDTLAASGLQGGLTFHVTRSFPAPLAELAEDYGRAVLV